MNRKLTASQFLAHPLNLALLPRNHGYEPTTLRIGERMVTVLRHAEGRAIAAVAVCGNVQLRTDGRVWAVWRGDERLVVDRVPARALDRFVDELGAEQVEGCNR